MQIARCGRVYGSQFPGLLSVVFRMIGLAQMLVLVCNPDSSNVGLEIDESEAYGLPIHVCAVTYCCLFLPCSPNEAQGLVP